MSYLISLKHRLARLGLLSLALMAPLSAPGLALAQSASEQAEAERKPQEKPVPNSLEHGLWDTSEKTERDAKTSGERDFDPALNAWVRGMTDKVSGPYAADLRLYIMDRPYFNAQMAPNGYTEVWTGLLLRAETEDEVAFVLGHELTHFRHNHSVESYDAMKSRSNKAAAASVLIAMAGADLMKQTSSINGQRHLSTLTNGLVNVVYLSALASYFSFSRENEREADRFSQTYIRAVGYNDLAGAHLWQTLLDETKASDNKKVRESPTRSNVFGSHPLEAERIAAIEAEHARLSGGKSVPYDDKPARLAYRDKIRPYLGAWIKDDLRRQDYGQTRFTLKRLKRDGQDLGLLNFYTGETYRLMAREARAKDSDEKTERLSLERTQALEDAVAAYKLALESPDAPKETNRQLGDVYSRQGRKTEAVSAWKAYIAANPTASDVWIIEDQIATAQKAG